MREELSENYANYLVAGLGNVGSEYIGTRHNIGFDVLDFFSKKKQINFQKEAKLHGDIARYRVEEKKILLLKPSTYMNLSGIAVRRVVDYYRIPLENFFVVLDDMDIPFGQIRIRAEGGTAGHNGLKSIENSLGTKAYSRLRIGIDKQIGNSVSHVLGKFTEEEKTALPIILEKAATAVDIWINKGMSFAISFANVRKSELKKDEIV